MERTAGKVENFLGPSWGQGKDGGAGWGVVVGVLLVVVIVMVMVVGGVVELAALSRLFPFSSTLTPAQPK